MRWEQHARSAESRGAPDDRADIMRIGKLIEKNEQSFFCWQKIFFVKIRDEVRGIHDRNHALMRSILTHHAIRLVTPAHELNRHAALFQIGYELVKITRRHCLMR